MVSTHLKNISPIRSFPQVGVNIRTVWNHHLGNNWLPYIKKKTTPTQKTMYNDILYLQAISFSPRILLASWTKVVMPTWRVGCWKVAGGNGDLQLGHQLDKFFSFFFRIFGLLLGIRKWQISNIRNVGIRKLEIKEWNTQEFIKDVRRWYLHPMSIGSLQIVNKTEMKPRDFWFIDCLP